MKNIIFHGPILKNVGTKPLYSAKNPSFLIVCEFKTNLNRIFYFSSDMDRMLKIYLKKIKLTVE